MLGVGVHAVDMESTALLLEDANQRTETRGYVCLAGVHGIMEAQRDLSLEINICRRSSGRAGWDADCLDGTSAGFSYNAKGLWS